MRVYRVMIEESVYYHGYRDDESVTYAGPTYSTIEEAERARDYYNDTHKSTDNYGCIAWVVQVQVLDKFDKKEFNKYIK